MAFASSLLSQANIVDLELPFIVATTESGKIQGFAYLAPWRQKAAYRRTVEDTIYLRPAAIGKRLGTRLLTELIDLAKQAGVKEIVAVISDKGADPSIALHEAFGFKRQGHLGKVGFKFNRWLGTSDSIPRVTATSPTTSSRSAN